MCFYGNEPDPTKACQLASENMKTVINALRPFVGLHSTSLRKAKKKTLLDNLGLQGGVGRGH